MIFKGVLRNLAVFATLVIVLGTVIGCSSGTEAPITAPDVNTPGLTGELEEGHNILAQYTITMDPVNMTAEARLNHSAEIHFNVAPFLLNNCPSCVHISLTGYDPDQSIYTLEVSLKNPMMFIGYDVKGIIFRDGSGEVDLLNPDVYTGLWAPEISPFRYFAKSALNYQFPPAATFKETFEIYVDPSLNPGSDIDFAIDAHWPGVQEDPIWIQDIDVENTGSTVTIGCNVIDAQDNVERVWADTTAFNGGDTELLFVSGTWYEASFPVGSAPGGMNHVLLNAKSEGTDVLLHHYADVFIDASGAILEGKVFNAITTQEAAGTKITVTNAVTGGFEPLPTVIPANGQYYYSMQPGNYNIEVITNNSLIQYDKMDTIYEVVINPDDHVVVDFAMGPSYLNDVTDQITCINGQVFNANTGEPVPFAQISISGGSQTGGVFQNRVTDLNGHYVFWKVPCKDNGNNPIQEFTISCVAVGYVPDERTAVPYGWNKNTPQENFMLQPIGGGCVWEDSFEDGGEPGWNYEMIGNCAQMWHIRDDAEVFNLNVTMDASDGGKIVELPPDDTSNGRVWVPWDGTWSLWYGEEDDGSFIHEWAGTTPGGTSTCAHSARAYSPVIDLTSYNQATVTWQQIWEIEGVDPSVQYDYLRVYVKEVGGGWFLFEHSNPTTEPVPDLGYGNAKHPQTSGGFDIAPVWQAIVWNLGDLDNPDTGGTEHMDFTGKQIQFRFDFGTVDTLYNGFRGWLVDDICIYPAAG